jgi:integrase
MRSEEPWYIEAAELAGMPFPQAAEAWLASRTPYISTKTFHEYQLNIVTLSKFFGEMTPRQISADQIRMYQRMRLSQQCGPSGINHEGSVLQQLLKRIGRWDEIGPDHEPLPLPKEPRGRVLTDEEKQKLFQVAKTNANWEATFLFAMLSINTTMGPKETLTLRLKDVDLTARFVNVQPEGAKNAHRVRVIPLNEEAFKAAVLAVDRARRLGSTEPNHYLFPFRLHRSLFDPAHHQTTLKTAWLRLVAAADLLGLRMYDLRHHAITALLEHPDTSEETVQSIAGHVSRQMLKRYSHVRLEAKRSALSALDGSFAPLTPEPPKLLPENTVSNQVVLDMLASGIPPEIVMAKIKGSHCAFDTSVETIKQLRQAQVPDSVIVVMLRRGQERA